MKLVEVVVTGFLKGVENMGGGGSSKFDGGGGRVCGLSQYTGEHGGGGV